MYGRGRRPNQHVKLKKQASPTLSELIQFEKDTIQVLQSWNDGQNWSVPEHLNQAEETLRRYEGLERSFGGETTMAQITTQQMREAREEIRQPRQTSPTLGFLRDEQIKTCETLSGWLSDASRRGDAQGVIGHGARLASAQETLARYEVLIQQLGEDFDSAKVTTQSHLRARRIASEKIYEQATTGWG